MNPELFSSQSSVLMAWLYSLAITTVLAVLIGIFPSRLERLRKGIPLLLIFPGLVVAVVYGAQGFGVLEKPAVHWVFEKEAPDALRLGLLFDRVSFIATTVFGLVLVLLGFKNRPTPRMSAALALSWVGVALVATSQTLWIAVIGVGLQLFSRVFPIIEESAFSTGEDRRWASPLLRSWIGLLCVVAGGGGLAAQGIQLDFVSTTPWITAGAEGSSMVAAALLFFGLFLMASPALASPALYTDTSGSCEEQIFVSEASLSWAVAMIFFRLLGGLHGTEWATWIGLGAAIVTACSLAPLLFLRNRRSAIHLWLSCFPTVTLMSLPFISESSARLAMMGALVAFSGLWVSLDHRRARSEIVQAGIFFLGAFGFVGWATAASATEFFSMTETAPLLCGSFFVVLVLYFALGWRIVLRGGERKNDTSMIAQRMFLAVIFLVGFGPLLSGQWAGGGLPGELDWIDGAKAWAWVQAEGAPRPELDWVGFGLSQALGLIALLLGTFAWRRADLFPFAEKYPRGAIAAEGLFGLLWIQAKLSSSVKIVGSFLTKSVSERIWIRGIPTAVMWAFRIFRISGAAVERGVDPLTAGSYGRVFVPAAKLVQWLHGGNVRYYAWFALIWVLFFSIYLTR